jgi:hypothetical protein
MYGIEGYTAFPSDSSRYEEYARYDRSDCDILDAFEAQLQTIAKNYTKFDSEVSETLARLNRLQKEKKF